MLHFRADAQKLQRFEIIAVGGETQRGLTSSVEVFDPASGKLVTRIDQPRKMLLLKHGAFRITVPGLITDKT